MKYSNVLILILLSTVSLNCQQQSDRPVADDLGDKKDAAATAYKRDIAKITAAEGTLRKLSIRDPGSPKSEGAFVQLRLMRCLAGGDYDRQIAAIYSEADKAAGQLANELETSGKPPESSAPAVDELRKKLEETKRRETELQSNPTPTSSAELGELSALENKLQEAIDTYLKIPAKEPNSDQAREIRGMEAQFNVLSQEAWASARTFDAQCISERQILYYLSQIERRQGQVEVLNHLLPRSSESREINGSSVEPSSAGSVQERDLAQRVSELENELKVAHQQLNDIAALQKRLEYLQSIVATNEAPR